MTAKRRAMYETRYHRPATIDEAAALRALAAAG
jgi:CO/xanthine dehydrogenase FAD-binding subunit